MQSACRTDRIKRAKENRQRAAEQQKPIETPQQPATPIAIVEPRPVEALKGRPGEDSANHQNNKKRRWCRRMCCRKCNWEAIFAGVVALFTGGQVWYGYLQWDSTEKQYQVMIDQNNLALAQQRPWIRLGANTDSGPQGNQPWTITVEMKNTGQSTAQLVSIFCDVMYFKPGEELPGVGSLKPSDSTGKTWHSRAININGKPFDLDLDFVFRNHFEKHGVHDEFDVPLPPDSTSSFIVSIPSTINEETACGVDDGSIVPVIIVLVRYSDAADREHVSQLVANYDRDTGSFEAVFGSGRLRHFG